MSAVDTVAAASSTGADLAQGFTSPNTLSREQSRKMVLVSIAALLAINVYRHTKSESSGSLYKRLWGTGIVGVSLSIAADFVPTIAGPFAVLVVLGSLTNGGDQAIQNALGKISSGVPLPAGPAKAGAAGAGSAASAVTAGLPGLSAAPATSGSLSAASVGSQPAVSGSLGAAGINPQGG